MIVYIVLCFVWQENIYKLINLSLFANMCISSFEFSYINLILQLNWRAEAGQLGYSQQA